MGSSDAFAAVTDWANLVEAYRKAARGKRGRPAAAIFEYALTDRLMALREDLLSGRYQPGDYVHFSIHDPKVRLISAAPFRDRVLHHALCNIIEPRFERGFIADSYANRIGKGTHAAVDRLQAFAKAHRYVLRLDIVRHFPSLDHAVLHDILARRNPEDDVLALVDAIIASAAGIHEDPAPQVWLPGDDLLTALRPRGLPIGNLTSQHWSNCYLDPLDHFIKRELRCKAYLRYVDDLALFSDSKAQLWAWKRAIVDRLLGLRLRIHEHSAQAAPVAAGIPWLGFVVWPDRLRVKARNVVKFNRRLRAAWAAYWAGAITFAELDAGVKGWVNHVRYADTWRLRSMMLGRKLPGRPPLRTHQKP